MAEGSDRVSVSTYVPATQRETWQDEAEDLGMSQSEFVRSMVQAGRRGFALGEPARNAEEPHVAGSNPRGDGLKTTVLDLVREEGPLGWDDIFEAVAGDLEADLDEAVSDLVAEGRVSHRPRTGEYALGEAPDGG